MSQPAARPWWADVQHLRPAEHGGTDDRPRSRRFDRPTPPPRRPSHEAPPARAANRTAAAPRRREHREPEEWLDAAPAPPRPVPRRAAEPEVWLDAAPAPPKPAQRRTIEIRGQVDRVAGVAPVGSPGPQRHRGRRPSERVGPRPDRVALWAVLLGLLLILVAAISSPDTDAAALLAPLL